jgi:uncharacterized protein (UPF0332 family)
MPRPPTWEDWLRSARLCERSMKFFERPKIGVIKTLPRRIAQENVLGHLRKAYHNLDLANKVFDMHEGKESFRYEGENYFDWVVTICYYAMYQGSLAALAAVRKEGETHAATVCALIYYYVHKRKRLGEEYLISMNVIAALAKQDVQKLVEKKEEREKASYDTSFITQKGLAERALTDAREFVAKIREILEEGLSREFLSEI